MYIDIIDKYHLHACHMSQLIVRQAELLEFQLVWPLGGKKTTLHMVCVTCSKAWENKYLFLSLIVFAIGKYLGHDEN